MAHVTSTTEREGVATPQPPLVASLNRDKITSNFKTPTAKKILVLYKFSVDNLS